MSVSNSGISLYRRVLKRFPKNVCFSFAYGSGVKSQIGYENRRLEDNVLDFIVCVEDDKLVNWHRDNIHINPGDYSSLKLYGPSFVSKYQRSIPANIYCNTLIPIPEENVTIKYGVVAKSDLINDCHNWKHFYLAGRLQKPVEIISQIPDDIKVALKKNLHQALVTAFLLLPEKFDEFSLFYKIAQFSYRGDFRMVFGENPNKVNNIVKPQLSKFVELYSKTISSNFPNLKHDANERMFYQDIGEKSRRELFEKLPISLRRKYFNNYNTVLANSIAWTVFKSSAIQSIKNIPTAGIIKSIKYSYSKAKKTFS